MSDTQSIDIDGLTFNITQLPGRRGLRAVYRLAKAILPAVGTAAGALGSERSSILDMDVGALASALGTAIPRLFLDLPEEEFMALVDLLLDGATVVIDGKLVALTGAGNKFDSVFKGRVDLIPQLLKFAVEVHFGGFFGDGGLLAKMLAAVGEKQASKSSSLKASGSTGLSGDS